MMYPLPKDPKKIRARIRRYERTLRNEKKEYGMISNGSGTRYLLAPLYLLMGDLEGAVASYKYYEEEFPDDIIEFQHCLCWSLALHRNGNEPKAIRKLGRAMLSNVYVMRHLLGLPALEPDIWWEFSDHGPSYFKHNLYHEFLDLWTPEEIKWARSHHQSPSFRQIEERFVEIAKILRNERPGPYRTQLVNESSKLQRLEI